jgi:membrane fusion protein (multidrug efflux system)
MKTQHRAATLLFSAALALACGGEKKTEEASGKPVVIAPVVLSDLEDHIEATGELDAKDEAAIAAEVPGQVTQVAIDEGAPVTAGDVVLEIDPQKRELELQSARARLAEAEAAVRDAEREYKRMKTLREQDVAAAAKMDQVETQVSLARSRAAAAQAQLGVAERALRDASVRAPFSGYVADRHVSRGEYVQVGQPLFDLVALDPVEVHFHVAERDSARVAQGQEVALTVEPHPGQTFRGRVTLIAPTIDPKTRTLRVEADVANTDGRLRPGLFARVDLGVALRKGVLMVPEEAVLQRADGEVVFRTTRGNRVQRVVVSTGSHRDGMVEVAQGLAAGDVIVTRGQAALVDGALVSPRNADGTIVRTDVSAAGDPGEEGSVQ